MDCVNLWITQLAERTLSTLIDPLMSTLTLEQLEGNAWGDPQIDSHLFATCHRLRKKPIDEFTTEDLRIMIGQNIGLKYLFPPVLELLENNPMVEGDFYAGDLLTSAIRVDFALL